MIRFINVTRDYFALDSPNEPVTMPICAFVNTVNDRFVEDDGAMHLFHGFDDIDMIANIDLRERCRRLVPDGFFDPSSDYWRSS